MPYRNVGKAFVMKVDEKTNERGPDYTGRFEVTESLAPGDIVQLSAWVETAEKSGKKYLSIQAQVYEEERVAPTPRAKSRPVEDDDIPF